MSILIHPFFWRSFYVNPNHFIWKYIICSVFGKTKPTIFDRIKIIQTWTFLNGSRLMFIIKMATAWQYAGKFPARVQWLFVYTHLFRSVGALFSCTILCLLFVFSLNTWQLCEYFNFFPVTNLSPFFGLPSGLLFSVRCVLFYHFSFVLKLISNDSFFLLIILL